MSSNWTPYFRPAASRTRYPSGTTSLPIPSPGMTAIWYLAMEAPRSEGSSACRASEARQKAEGASGKLVRGASPGTRIALRGACAREPFRCAFDCFEERLDAGELVDD